MSKKKAPGLLKSAQGARAKAGSAKGALYDRRQANRISLWFLGVIVVLLVAYVGIELGTDQVSVSDGTLQVRSLFGFSVPLAEVKELSFEASPAVVGSRTVGNDAFGLFKEGNYQVEGLGKARIFLKRPNVSYIILRTDDRDFAISLGPDEKNRALYDRIKLEVPSGK